ncbi:hypothetical protein ACHWQZ_G003831 [Mnemiopsis leidyi]
MLDLRKKYSYIDFANNDFLDLKFYSEDILLILRSLNPSKAAGPDGIHGKVLKYCASSLAYPLSILFNLSFVTGCIPPDWKLASVVPVFKKGDKGSVENYRPISLTSLVMKVFERCIKTALFSVCEDVLDPRQHGFLNNRSCVTQMVPFVHDLATNLNDKIRTDIIYFDFTKAFDSVSHDLILRKLKEEFKVDGLMLRFIKSYLEGREQQVVIGGQTSSKLPVHSGVPQGSILGPLLFVLFNDMFACISGETDIALYADDTKIWRRITMFSDHHILQNDINNLFDWSVNNNMVFHPNKCKALTISKFRNEFDKFPFNVFIYEINGTCIDYVNSQRDLGVELNNNLNWGSHHSMLVLQASSRLGLLRRTCHFNANVRQKRAFYLAIVMAKAGLHKWVCPTDRELCLRSKLNNGMGWSYKSVQSGLKPTCTRETFAKHEIDKIEEVIKKHNELVQLEEERIGKLMERFENMKCSQGDGYKTCLFCNASFGFLKAKPFRCHMCQRNVCSKCKVETEKRQIVLPKILCRVCSEYREIWKKSNAWFFHAIPKYVIPPKLPKQQPKIKNSPVQKKPIERPNKVNRERFWDPDSDYLSTTDDSDESDDSDSDDSDSDDAVDKSNKDDELDGDDSTSGGISCDEDQVLDAIASDEINSHEKKDDLETGELGAIRFSLQYDPIEQMLNIQVFSGHKLKPMDVGGTSDPYVKCTLIPGHPKATKLKTSRKECDLNPVFNEKLTYHGIFDSDIKTKMVRLTVLDYDRMTKNDMIGITTVPLDGLIPQKQHLYGEILKEPEDETHEASAIVDRGRIQISLHYQANKELKVTIVRCSMLMVPGSDTLPNPMVKVNIRPSPKRNTFKRKTEILKQTSNPEFGHKAKFTYDITSFDIESNDRCLEVTVWDCTGLKRHSYIGGVVLGKESGGSTRSHWEDALSSCGHRVTRWHMLEGESTSTIGECSSIELTDQSQADVANPAAAP